MRKWPWFLISVMVLVLDQASKFWMVVHFAPYEPYPIFPGLNITLAWNSGAAFSFLSGAGGWHRWFFAAFSVVMCGVFACWLWRLKPNEKRHALALSLLLGGAAGNLVDRVWYGYVVDFIEVYYHNFHWPIFNIADSAICTGALLLMIDMVRFSRKKPLSLV